ncbi:MAG: hypothetical protein QNJ98_02075 [Planctomycetota bacterium]|nr:hypothetical protein [Planctomycetota bacterium]
MLLATRGTCVLDQPEAPIDDPELVAALKKRALTIHVKAIALTVVFTAATMLCPV